MKDIHDKQTGELFTLITEDQVELAKRCLRWQREALALRDENSKLRDRLHRLETRSTWPRVPGGTA